MADIAGLLGATDTSVVVKNSTSRTGNTELDMQDFLQLMIVQLQNQTIDDTMDTSEMMNQMVQMQMISAITNLTETSVTSYASSLVGKTVTIGITDGNTLEEREILVMGTGVSNGQQVIFGSDGETYALNQIMAVGRLPNEDGTYGTQKPSSSTDKDTADKDTGDVTDPDDKDTTVTGSGSSGEVEGSEEGKLPDDRPVEGSSETEDTPAEGSQDDVVNPAAAVE